MTAGYGLVESQDQELRWTLETDCPDPLPKAPDHESGALASISRANHNSARASMAAMETTALHRPCHRPRRRWFNYSGAQGRGFLGSQPWASS